MRRTEINNFFRNTKYSTELDFSKKMNNSKLANKNIRKNAYWFTIDLDNRIKKDYHFVLYNQEKKVAIYLKVPPDFFLINRFSFSSRNNCPKMDIYLSCSEETFLIDIKSGGSKFDFKPFIIEEFILGDLND